jgi:hypothetical protein
MLPLALQACSRLLATDGSDNAAVCPLQILHPLRLSPQAATYHSLSVKRSRWRAPAEKGFGTLPDRWDERLQRFRASCGAMQLRAAAALSTERTQRNGMPTALRDDPSLRNC